MKAHDLNNWHPLTDHHHGSEPTQYIPVFGPPLAGFLATYGEIGFPWKTSEAEEHEGYLWLRDTARPGDSEPGKNQITEVLLQVHSTGEAAHFLKRYHSDYLFAVVTDGKSSGVVGTGGWVDFANAHQQYKQKFFSPLLSTDLPGMKLGQQPYRSQVQEYHGDDYLPQFWSGQRPNPIAQNLFKPVPQHIRGVGWSNNAKTFFGYGGLEDVQTASGALGNRKFQIFNIQLHNLPAPRPFYGFTDRFGYLVQTFETLAALFAAPADVDHVPLIITEGVPHGEAALARRVQQGNPSFAPILDFNPGSTPPPPEPGPRPGPSRRTRGGP